MLSNPQHLSLQLKLKNHPSYKWTTISFFVLVYATLTSSAAAPFTMKRPLIDTLQSKEPLQNDLYFNPTNTSNIDCDHWRNSYLNGSTAITSTDSSLYGTPLLPVSFIVEMIPYPRLTSGRSFFFTRLDNYNRIRLAIGINQWGKTGESMELWIHHELFYSIEPTPRISRYYTGSGLVNHAGLVVVPLPNYQYANQAKPITLIIEITDVCVKVFNKFNSFKKPLYQIYYHQNIKYHHLHGDTFENKSEQSSMLDRFYILSGGPHHGDKFMGFTKQLKMFFTEYGARKYSSDNSHFKSCEYGISLENITNEWKKLNLFDQSNQTGEQI
ncbi:unnamed protein product [Trichobilharzia szidati]|nr:unnamed protein product [Trichobilharzia szidati]